MSAAYTRLHESEVLLSNLQSRHSKAPPKDSEPPPSAAHKWAQRVSRLKKQKREELVTAQRKGDLSLQELEARIQRLRTQQAEDCKAKEQMHREHQLAVKAQLRRQQASADLELEDQLAKYHTRMQHFDHTHSQQLRSRAQSAASRRRSRPPSPGGQEDQEVARLLTFLAKQHNRDQRLQRSRNEHDKSTAQQRQRNEQRALKVEKNKRESARLTETRLRELEQRFSTSPSDSRRQSVMKESYYRQEQLRSRASRNRSRLQRIHSARQAQLLHRSAEASRRVQSLKASRLSQLERYEEALQSSLLERDRTYELVERIARSPDCKRAELVVRELGS